MPQTLLPGLADRRRWVDTLARIITPVLEAAADGRLQREMPVDMVYGRTPDDSPRRRFSHIEALARCVSGASPWFAVDRSDIDSDEAALCDRLTGLARKALARLDPEEFTQRPADGRPPCDKQLLVEAAILGSAYYRNPALWDGNADARERLARALLNSRTISPVNNNWLLFVATIEAVLCRLGHDVPDLGEVWDQVRVEFVFRQVEKWYAGDGLFDDGESFHADYYNSFVILPMAIDVLKMVGSRLLQGAEWEERFTRRTRRAARIFERFVSPEGAIAPIGRSMSYRFGTLHLLAHQALHAEDDRAGMPIDGVPAGALRAMLTCTMERFFTAPKTFDDHGWLTIGFCGHQPAVAEYYISTGSTYLTTFSFLPLGLPPTAPFWALPPADWSSKRMYAGIDSPADKVLKD